MMKTRLRKGPLVLLRAVLVMLFVCVFPEVSSSDPSFTQEKKLLPAGSDRNDAFGYSLSISGDTLVVGAAYDEDNGAYSGSVYVFYRDHNGSDNWGQVKKITPSDGAATDYFGCAVSVSGDTLVVGAYLDDDNGENSGSAYVFYRNQGGADNWGQVQKLTASDGAVQDYFGYSVSVSGETVVVGSYQDDNSSGSAYIYYRDQGGADNWGEVKKIVASDGAIEDRFGYSVSISGDAAVVGAYGDNDNGAGSGSAYIFYRDQGGADNWGQMKKIMASDGAADDSFGLSVSISDDTVLVGAYRDDDKGNDSGSAYIFYRDQGGPDNWGQVKKILASDGAADDFFGYSVSISGDTALVGAFIEDTKGLNSGSAYIFDRDHGGANNWGQVRKIMASDGAAGDYFGYSVSISGDTAVAGAYQHDDSGDDSGATYVFDRDQDGTDKWGQVKRIVPSDGAAEDWFGYAVSISGSTLVIGAPHDDDNGSDSGAVYIFDRNQGGPDNWGQVKKITASDGAADDFFGYSVSISGDTLVVGAHQDFDVGYQSGSAYIFDRDHGGADNWGEVKKITPSDATVADHFGFSVSVHGDTVVVGSPYDDDNGSGSGSAYIFDRNNGGANNWGQVKKIKASDGASDDWFGYSVSISGDTVVAGAFGNDDSGAYTGSAYIFDRNEGCTDNWGEVQILTASDAAAGDHFGYSVSISGDTVVVGAAQNDDSGADSGCAYIFDRDQGGVDNWGQTKKITASDGAAGDYFGFSVTISGDTLAIGADLDDDNGVNAGSAYVFKRNRGGPSNWGQVQKINPSDGAANDWFGSSVSISGDTVVVGAYLDDDNGSGSGSVYIFGGVFIPVPAISGLLLLL